MCIQKKKKKQRQKQSNLRWLHWNPEDLWGLEDQVDPVNKDGSNLQYTVV